MGEIALMLLFSILIDWLEKRKKNGHWPYKARP
jgi:hypothetical protein